MVSMISGIHFFVLCRLAVENMKIDIDALLYDLLNVFSEWMFGSVSDRMDEIALSFDLFVTDSLEHAQQRCDAYAPCEEHCWAWILSIEDELACRTAHLKEISNRQVLVKKC